MHLLSEPMDPRENQDKNNILFIRYLAFIDDANKSILKESKLSLYDIIKIPLIERHSVSIEIILE